MLGCFSALFDKLKSYCWFHWHISTLKERTSTHCYSPASEGSRKVTNFTWRKNSHTPVNDVKEFVCLSVCLWQNLTSIISGPGEIEWAEIFLWISSSKNVFPKFFFSQGAGMAWAEGRKANFLAKYIILCHQLSNFTLTISRYIIRDLERLNWRISINVIVIKFNFFGKRSIFLKKV